MNAFFFILLNKCDIHTAYIRTFVDAILKVFRPQMDILNTWKFTAIKIFRVIKQIQKQKF